MTKRFDANRLYDKVLKGEAEKSAGQKFLRKNNRLSRREIESLQENSSLYPAWHEKYVAALKSLEQNGIHTAKVIALYFARCNFKTLGGLTFTPRWLLY